MSTDRFKELEEVPADVDFVWRCDGVSKSIGFGYLGEALVKVETLNEAVLVTEISAEESFDLLRRLLANDFETDSGTHGEDAMIRWLEAIAKWS
jgi:hypothetical protein